MLLWVHFISTWPWVLFIATSPSHILRAENDTLGSDYPVMRDGKWLWIKKEPEGDISQVKRKVSQVFLMLYLVHGSEVLTREILPPGYQTKMVFDHKK